MIGKSDVMLLISANESMLNTHAPERAQGSITHHLKATEAQLDVQAARNRPVAGSNPACGFHVM